MNSYYNAVMDDGGFVSLEAEGILDANAKAWQWAQDESERAGARIHVVSVTPAFRWVNAYSVERCWGGPEEGGWWYDAHECIASVPTRNEAETEQIKELLTETIGWQNERTRYSVIGGADFVMYVENEHARSQIKERPRYE